MYVKHPIYNDWTVIWYACVCKLCMSSLAKKIETIFVFTFTLVIFSKVTFTLYPVVFPTKDFYSSSFTQYF